jgi:hypothetical protein
VYSTAAVKFISQFALSRTAEQILRMGAPRVLKLVVVKLRAGKFRKDV